ncbi:MAG: bifunctional phosphoglucose/phosphomannose isomerase [Candidatus Paceibacterota bacterium]
MENILKNFSAQFAFQPEIINSENLKGADKFIVAGMGGSHLSAGFIKIAAPKLDLLIHRDYGLPRVPDYFLNDSLIICSSYSGETEETLDVFNESLKKGLNLAVVSSGGQLLRLALENKIPFVKIPAGFPPRLALGFSLKALLKLIGLKKEEEEVSSLSSKFRPESFIKDGEKFAEFISGKIPVVYSSLLNFPLAYAWKIKFNETAKIPAFANYFPELNHNEMEGFSSGLNKFAFIFLSSSRDSAMIKKRMAVTSEIFKSVLVNESKGDNVFEEIFSSLLIAGWASLSIAKSSGVNPLSTPLIDSFKQKIKN